MKYTKRSECFSKSFLMLEYMFDLTAAAKRKKNGTRDEFPNKFPNKSSASHLLFSKKQKREGFAEVSRLLRREGKKC